MSTTTTIVSPGIERQVQYVQQQARIGDDSLIVGSAFIRGIRDLGYQTTAKAIDELVDNSVQAGAQNIHIAFSMGGKGGKEITSYAVIDDGLGMIPDMLCYAAKWGGTERENDRSGFGRYGYGLPSSCVSQGRRFRVFSRTEGVAMHGVKVDLDALNVGEGGRIPAPIAEEAQLPTWLQEYVDKHFDGLVHGTVVLVEALDRLTWTSREGLKKNLLEHVGLVYRTYLEDRKIVVDGITVQAIDPLFLTPGARLYDLDADRAVPYEANTITMKTADGSSATIKVRIAYLPPTFGFVDKTKTVSGPPANRNPRTAVMGDHEGIIIMRMGRQMDVITRHPWVSQGEDGGRVSSYRAEDRYWQVELDFPASLDEKFYVTTSKQSVRLHESVWDALETNGVRAIIDALKKRHKDDVAKVKTASETIADQKKPSEAAMESAARFEGAKPNEEQSAAAERGRAAAAQEIEKTAKETGLPVEQVRMGLEEEVAKRPFVIMEDSPIGGPFYRPEAMLGQTRIWLNTSHEFFTQLYAGPDSTDESRAALETLLFVLGSHEVGAAGDRLHFYVKERSKWSEQLKTVLHLLPQFMADKKADAEG